MNYSTNTPAQNAGVAVYLAAVWVGVTILFHREEPWGWVHAALAAVVPAVAVGGALILALMVVVAPFGLVAVAWSAWTERRRDRRDARSDRA